MKDNPQGRKKIAKTQAPDQDIIARSEHALAQRGLVKDEEDETEDFSGARAIEYAQRESMDSMLWCGLVMRWLRNLRQMAANGNIDARDSLRVIAQRSAEVLASMETEVETPTPQQLQALFDLPSEPPQADSSPGGS
jgi:hypothetical protein